MPEGRESRERYAIDLCPTFRRYGYAGLALIALAETSILLQFVFAPSSTPYTVVRTINQWTTPLCWWGYILFLDALIFRLKGNSLLMNRRREFWLQLPLSILIWLIFEVYNLHLDNWHYVGLPQNFWVRQLGYILAFATIMPGLFQTAELLETLGLFTRFRLPPFSPSSRFIYLSIGIGLLSLIVPLLLPRFYARYLFALVWVGFVLLLDPIVYSSGGDALLRDLEEGSASRILSLFIGGLICGFFWEFWNYWATAKWIYTVPFTQDVRIFEMPIAGFWGFGPFAWEYFAFYNFLRLIRRQKTPPRLVLT
ncbi:MAG: hypothetical protein D6736_03670 [Nitrospinota bacterium]|nr:MAG: hypothetical protein D6736_03670 [Nitrospinota bacterium]